MSNSIEERWVSSKSLSVGMAMLLDANEYAEDVQGNIWEFAVEIRRMLNTGMNETDFRWLVRKGYAEHACEVTLRDNDGREFCSTGDLTFTSNSCFVPTRAGVEAFRSLLIKDNEQVISLNGIHSHNYHSGTENGLVNLNLPDWDPDLRKLSIDGELVKRFKWPAMNQEAVLTVFQEEGWPERIDDPLSPKTDQDPKRRLADTIKCLNRKQKKRLILFHGDGTGEGITWERTG